MERLSEQVIVERIKNGELLTALVDTGAYTVRVRKYVPAVFTAIHDGHVLDPALAGRMLVSPAERKFEEDPFTGDLVDAFSISLRAHHSRYYYDLNRQPERCIYDRAWGKQVWNGLLSAEEEQLIRAHHRSYYRILDVLLNTLEKRFNHCAVYDLHSYNYSRINGTPPLFNIGTHYINRNRYDPVLHHLADQLRGIDLNGHETRTVFNDVFNGMGYQAEYIHTKHPASLCIPLEIKKIFMDETSLVLDHSVSDTLFPGLMHALACNAVYFADTLTTCRFGRAAFLPDGWSDQE